MDADSIAVTTPATATAPVTAAPAGMLAAGRQACAIVRGRGPCLSAVYSTSLTRVHLRTLRPIAPRMMIATVAVGGCPVDITVPPPMTAHLLSATAISLPPKTCMPLVPAIVTIDETAAQLTPATGPILAISPMMIVPVVRAAPMMVSIGVVLVVMMAMMFIRLLGLLRSLRWRQPLRCRRDFGNDLTIRIPPVHPDAAQAATGADVAERAGKLLRAGQERQRLLVPQRAKCRLVHRTRIGYPAAAGGDHAIALLPELLASAGAAKLRRTVEQHHRRGAVRRHVDIERRAPDPDRSRRCHDRIGR